MRHQAAEHERLRAIGSLSFSSTIAGHVAVETLLKRFRLVSTLLDPATIDEGWHDSGPALWSQLAQHALGQVPKYAEATREELHKMARACILAIEKYAQRCDYYPDGWQRVAATIANGIPDPAAQTAAPRMLVKGSTRQVVLDALNYVACELAIDEEVVLRRIRRKRAELRQGDDRRLLALLDGL